MQKITIKEEVHDKVVLEVQEKFKDYFQGVEDLLFREFKSYFSSGYRQRPDKKTPFVIENEFKNLPKEIQVFYKKRLKELDAYVE